MGYHLPDRAQQWPAQQQSSQQTVSSLRHHRTGQAVAAARRHCRRQLPRPTGTSSCVAQVAELLADITLRFGEDEAPAYVFGVEHCEAQPHIAEFILQQRPAAVVVETALTVDHGAATGSMVSCSEQAVGQDALYLRMFCQLAAQVAQLSDPLNSQLWRQLQARFNGEQLAYVAALATKASLVYGDRPKHITYHRLHNLPSITDLDTAFGLQSLRNYRDILDGVAPERDVLSPSCVEQVMLAERNIIMHQAMRRCCQEAGEGRCVVGVVGEGHLAGLRHLQRSQRWRTVSQADADLLQAPGEAPQRETAEQAAVRRALLDALVRLHCRPEVGADMLRVLGPVAEEQAEVYSVARELYGSTRMLLAVLPREALAQVCGGWHCDMWRLLAPLRAVRPLNGGPGHDLALVHQLRTLHFQLQ